MIVHQGTVVWLIATHTRVPTEFALESGDALAHRRLRHRQALRRSGEGPCFDDGDEHTQARQIDHVGIVCSVWMDSHFQVGHLLNQ